MASAPPETARQPSGEKATLLTTSVCPVKHCMARASQRRPLFVEPFLLNLTDLLLGHCEGLRHDLPRFGDRRTVILRGDQSEEDVFAAPLRQFRIGRGVWTVLALS